MNINTLTPHDVAAFDGRHRIELLQGDYIAVSMSPYPMPTVCAEDQSLDWFESLRRCLHWNERTRQKGLNESPSVGMLEEALYGTERLPVMTVNGMSVSSDKSSPPRSYPADPPLDIPLSDIMSASLTSSSTGGGERQAYIAGFATGPVGRSSTEEDIEELGLV